MTSLDDFAAVPDPTPKGWEAGVEMGLDGGTITSGPVESPITDWSDILRIWNLDPESFEVVEPATFKAWDGFAKETRADGTQEVVSKRLYSYKAQIRRRSPVAIKPEVLEAWHKKLLKVSPPPSRSISRGGETYAMFVADPQLGKKRTSEAVDNWKRGVLAHISRFERLSASGHTFGGVLLGFQGDEHEQVANNYCVGVDERVLTADLQWVRAGDLVEGQPLYAVDEEAPDRQGRRWAPAQVVSNEIQTLPAVRVVFEDGSSLVCTSEHPFLARTIRKHGPGKYRWVQARDLMSRPYAVAKPLDAWDEPTDYDTGWMGGLLDGEGSLVRAAGHESPSALSFAQKTGDVLDRALKILDRDGFDVSVYERAGDDVRNVRISGGYPEVLRALGTYRPVRLMSKIGHPRFYSRTVRVVSVEDAGLQQIAVMGTTSKTYIASGFASHNTNQPHTVELNLSEQIELDFALRVWTIEQVAALGVPVLVTSVLSNHGEWTRNDSKDPVTTKADNSSTCVMRLVAHLVDRAPNLSHIAFNIAESNPDIVVEVSGVKVVLSHGHIAKGKGSTSEQKVKTAIERQILGRTQEIGDAQIYITAHYHHFHCQEFEGRTLFGCPALEAERSSEYMLDQYGVWSPPGMLGLIIGSKYPRGWSEVAVL